jgi:hypothetical protein
MHLMFKNTLDQKKLRSHRLILAKENKLPDSGHLIASPRITNQKYHHKPNWIAFRFTHMKRYWQNNNRTEALTLFLGRKNFSTLDQDPKTRMDLSMANQKKKPKSWKLNCWLFFLKKCYFSGKLPPWTRARTSFTEIVYSPDKDPVSFVSEIMGLP